MRLEIYLKDRGIPREKFARSLGVSRQAIDHWIRGHRFPRPEHVMKIEQMTEGLVCANDWYVPNIGSNRRKI